MSVVEDTRRPRVLVVGHSGQLHRKRSFWSRTLADVPGVDLPNSPCCPATSGWWLGPELKDGRELRQRLEEIQERSPELEVLMILMMCFSALVDLGTLLLFV